MRRIIQGQLVTLFAMLMVLGVTLAACGGGSSTGGGGGGSGATISGTVSDGVAAVYPDGRDQPLLVAVADLLVEPARAGGVRDVLVELFDASGIVPVDSTLTDANGRFEFTNLDAGTTYIVRILGEDIAVTTGTSDKVEMQVDDNGALLSVEVQTSADDNMQVSGRVEDDRSSDDDDSSMDGASADDDSADNDSADGDSDGDSNAGVQDNDDGDSEDSA